MSPDVSVNGSRSPGTADAHWLEAWRRRAWRRWRVLVSLFGAVVALAAALWGQLALEAFGASSVSFAIGVGLVVLVTSVARTRGVRDVRGVLAEAEQTTPELRNALLAWHEHGGSAPPAVAARLAAQARHPLETASWPNPHGRWAWGLALGCLLGAALLQVAGRPTEHTVTVPPVHLPSSGRDTHVSNAELDWAVTVTAPAYARQPVAHLTRPARVEVLAGSRIDVRFTSWLPQARVLLGNVPVPAGDEASGRATVTFRAAQSDVLLARDPHGQVLGSIAIVVRPDGAPVVRIVEPAADLRRARADGVVRVGITARDDVGMRELRLRYTKVSGSGESFTFVDGEWPVRVSQESRTTWRGAFALDLSALGLGPGDSVVYHAVAHDARPGAEGAAESERFLIEISRTGDVAGGDFSLPDPDAKFALSQRMVIQLTERLLEQQPRLTPDDYRQQAQALAIAQRRVRAEFVFMLGGDVEDEFEEAAHSYEIEAGRHDNRGRRDLTEAVREMAQAEARLTDADVREALPYEYRALEAVQAALGRSRYFMRTLPVRIRIDASRRLAGDRRDASSVEWERTPVAGDRRAAAMEVLRRLEAATEAKDAAARAGLLPDLVALDRGNADWIALSRQVLDAEGSQVALRALRARVLAVSPSWMAVPLSRDTREASAQGAGTP